MSESLMRMWISFAGMGFMFFAIILIYFSRYKLKGIFRIMTGLVAYILMILSGIIIFFIVFSAPTG